MRGETWKGVVMRPETYVPSAISDGRGCRREPEEVAENIPAEPACQAGGLPLSTAAGEGGCLPQARSEDLAAPCRRSGGGC